MTIRDMAERFGLRIYSGDAARLDTAVSGGYCGDLLSWVMSRAPENGVWLTIMSNVNVAAVLELSGAACVVLCEGVTPDEALLSRARAQGLALLGTDASAFALAGQIHAALS